MFCLRDKIKVKIIAFILCFFFVSVSKVCADADKLTVTAISDVIHDSSGYIQNINLTFKPSSDWTLSVIALDQQIQNSNNPQKSLPIQDLRIIDPTSEKEYILESGKKIIVKTGLKENKDQGSVTLQLKIKLIANETNYPGNYVASIEFNAETTNKTISESYTQTYNLPLVQELAILPSTLNYTVPTDSLLKTGQKIKPPNSARLLIRSNAEWKLSVKNDNPSESIIQAVNIKTLPENAVQLIPNDFKTLNLNEFDVARGNPTVIEGLNTLQAQVIELEYQFSPPEAKIMPSGVYPFSVQYTLDTI